MNRNRLTPLVCALTVAFALAGCNKAGEGSGSTSTSGTTTGSGTGTGTGSTMPSSPASAASR